MRKFITVLKLLRILSLTAMMTTSCSGSAPPDTVLNSIVIARSGIDDFGGLTVKQLVKALEDFTKMNGGEIQGWKKENGVYIFTIQQPNWRAGSMVFQPIDDHTVFIYSPDTRRFAPWTVFKSQFCGFAAQKYSTKPQLKNCRLARR